jgi:hypothetical protein
MDIVATKEEIIKAFDLLEMGGVPTELLEEFYSDFIQALNKVKANA